MFYQTQEESKDQSSNMNSVPLQSNPNSSIPVCSPVYNQQTLYNPYFCSTNFVENTVPAFNIPPPPISYYVPPYPPPDFPAVNQISSVAQSNISGHYLSSSYPYNKDETQKSSGFRDVKSELEKEKVMNDEMWLSDWLSRRKPSIIKTNVHKNVKVSEAKENLTQIIFLLQELNEMKSRMQESYKDMEETQWNSLCCDFELRKVEILNILSKIPSKEKLKTAVSKRLKKRMSLKRRKSKLKNDNVLAREKRQQLHHQIDTWMKDMQAAIDNKKREESLKKEADCVLSEVLRKKADGRRQLSLMAALLKLRQLRAKSAANRGQNISVDTGIKFLKVADNLKVLWEKQLKEYVVEENGMRVMLSEAVDERDQSRVLRERHIISEWNKLLFGSNKCNNPEFFFSADQSIESFIQVRQSWDKFIVSNKTSVQSKIPIGWILPCNPSSSEWAKLLERVSE